MPVNYQGDGRVYGYTVFAGTDGIGSVDVSIGSYSLSGLQLGTNFSAGAVPLAEGSLNVTDGTNLTFEYQGAGTPPGGFGLGATVGRADGYGSANGVLRIEGGSTVAFDNLAEEDASGFLSGAYGNLNIGRGAGANGIVGVEGAGSTLTASGDAARITVGRDTGAGALEISDGAIAGTFNLTVGRDQGRGIVNVDGAGSELRLGFEYGAYGAAYDGSNSYSSIGRGFNGQGILAVQNGGALRIENNDGINDGAFLRLGRDEDSFGYAVVSGTGSTLSLNQVGALDQGNTGNVLLVGQGGRGIAAIEQDGQLNVTGDGASIVVASGRGGSQELLQSELILRSGADAVVDSRDAGAPTGQGAQVVIGSAAGLSGKVIVDGPGTSLTIRSDNTAANPSGASLRVGVDGDGRIEITDGATVEVDQGDDPIGGLFVSGYTSSAAGSGYVLVDGVGSSLILNSTADAAVGGSQIKIGTGENDTGTLAIRNGGTLESLSTGGDMSIGGVPGSSGTVIVEGAGSVLRVENDLLGQIRVGSTLGYGTGVLDLLNGGSVYTGNVLVGETGVLNFGGNLFANSTINGTLNVGGEDAVGDGTLVGDLDVAAGADLIFEAFDLSTGDVDTLNVSGDLNVAVSDLDIDLSHLARVSVGDTWTFLTTGTQTPSLGTVPFAFTNPIPGVTFSATNDGTNVILTADVAPDKTVGIFGADRSVVEGDFSGAPVLTVELRRSGDLTVTMDVDVAVSAFGGSTIDGSDFDGGVLPSGTVQFGVGEDTLTFDITLTGDDLFEGDEEFEVTLSNVVTGDASAATLLQDSILVTVQDDDLAPDLQITGDVTGGGDFHFQAIDPASAFVRLDNADAPVGNAIALDISDTGLDFQEGEFLLSRVIGQFNYDSYGSTIRTAHGVFSTSSTLLGGGYQYRIPDALGVPNLANGVYSANTPIDGYARDFNGDFALDGLAQVPTGANYLFLGSGDVFYSDNTAAGTFGVALFTPVAIGVYGNGNAIISSENFDDAAVAIGFGNGARGDLTLRDTNWDLTVGGTVGENGGDGRLLLTDGSRVTVSDPGTYGVSTDPGFNIGTENGSGYVNIGGGSSLKVDSNFVYLGAGDNPPNTPQFTGGYNNVTIGDTRGVGTLTVEGYGSLLETYGYSNRVTVGRNYGDGFLNIRDGGEVRATSINAGRNSGTGIVNVTGEGSLLLLSNATGTYGTARYGGSSGFSTFGRSFGEGSLRISDGGTVFAENLDGVTDVSVIRFGRDLGSEGFGEIIGAGSSLNIRQHGAVGDQYSGLPGLRVGEGGLGGLTLSQGASVNLYGDQMTLAVARGRSGQGADETSELSILSGSTVTVDSGGYQAGSVVVAYGNNTNGAITVDGYGSKLTVTSSFTGSSDYTSAEIIVGNAGNGRLTVSNDAEVEARELHVGNFGGLSRGYVSIESGGAVTLEMPDNPLHAGDPSNQPTGYRGARIGASGLTHSKESEQGFP